MLSNSDPKNENPQDHFFEEAYKEFRIERVKANRMTNCNAIGYDINKNAVDISPERLSFKVDNGSKQSVSLGDVRNLSNITE